MQILKRLTLANLQQNRRRTLVTVLGVMLSTALILAVIGMATSFQNMMVSYALVEYGDYHEMYQDVPADAIDVVTENRHIEQVLYSAPVTPETVNEDTYKTYTTWQRMPYQAAWIDFSAIPPENEQTYNLFVRYDEPKRYAEIREGILAALESATGQTINYRTNGDLLRYQAMAISDTTLSVLYGLAGIVIGIIIVTSVFVIRNSFSISATERTRQFGMLSSVGATPRQIRRSVLFEGVAIGALGIPLGILLGVVAVAVLVAIVNILLGEMLPVTVGIAMPFLIFPLAIVLGAVTIFFSSLMPAIRAGRIAPIEAIRGNQDIKIRSKKLKTPKLVRNVFGIGGVIAYKNLRRSRKKYRTTVISIVLSVATFIGLSSFLSYGQKILGLEYQNVTYDMEIAGEDAEFYRDLQNKFQLGDSVYYLATSSADYWIQQMQREKFEEFAKHVGVKTNDYTKVVILNDMQMAARDKGGYEYRRAHPELKDGDIVTFTRLEYVTEKIESSDGLIEVTMPKAAGETELKVDKITDERPLGFEQFYSPIIVVSEDYYRPELLGSLGQQTTLYIANLDDTSELKTYLDREYPEAYYYDVMENMMTMRRVYLVVGIFLYGFITVVTLIGVTNIFNTITTNIALRSKEFAMLRSVGMTDAEFRRMVRLESLMYVTKALVIGVPIGCVLSYAFYLTIAEGVDFGYMLPWQAILISIAAASLLILTIMRYSVRQVAKQNIIETIRAENI